MAEEKSGAEQSERIEDTERGTIENRDTTTEKRDDQPYTPPSTPPVGTGDNQRQDEPSAE
jgi:hypothetical protein